jgi:hypothetical protein
MAIEFGARVTRPSESGLPPGNGSFVVTKINLTSLAAFVPIPRQRTLQETNMPMHFDFVPL